MLQKARKTIRPRKSASRRGLPSDHLSICHSGAGCPVASDLGRPASRTRRVRAGALLEADLDVPGGVDRRIGASRAGGRRTRIQPDGARWVIPGARSGRSCPCGRHRPRSRCSSARPRPRPLPRAPLGIDDRPAERHVGSQPDRGELPGTALPAGLPGRTRPIPPAKPGFITTSWKTPGFPAGSASQVAFMR